MKTFLIAYFAIVFAVLLFMWLLTDKYGNLNSHIALTFKWYDGWIGWFWDTKKRFLYIFPLPFFGIIIKPYRNNFS